MSLKRRADLRLAVLAVWTTACGAGGAAPSSIPVATPSPFAGLRVTALEGLSIATARIQAGRPGASLEAINSTSVSLEGRMLVGGGWGYTFVTEVSGERIRESVSLRYDGSVSIGPASSAGAGIMPRLESRFLVDSDRATLAALNFWLNGCMAGNPSRSSWKIGFHVRGDASDPPVAVVTLLDASGDSFGSVIVSGATGQALSRSTGCT